MDTKIINTVQHFEGVFGVNTAVSGGSVVGTHFTAATKKWFLLE